MRISASRAAFSQILGIDSSALLPEEVIQNLSTVAPDFDLRVFCAPVLRTDREAQRNASKACLAGDSGSSFSPRPLLREIEGAATYPYQDAGQSHPA
jgi:hypothetical protein